MIKEIFAKLLMGFLVVGGILALGVVIIHFFNNATWEEIIFVMLFLGVSYLAGHIIFLKSQREHEIEESAIRQRIYKKVKKRMEE